MENKKPKRYNFITQVLILFAADVLILMIISHFFGDDAKELSSLYRLGSKGLASATMLQFLFNSVVIISLKSLFFHEKLFKSMLTLWRTIFMLISVFLSTIVFILVFDWFPIRNVYAWSGFLICFGGGFLIGMLTMIVKTNLENKKYKDLLSSYKSQHGWEDLDE